MDHENEGLKEQINRTKIYKIDRAFKYVCEHESKDGSESSLEVCIISDLLRIIREFDR